MAEDGNKPANQVARELEIRVNQLGKWKQQLEHEALTGAPARRGRRVDGEVERLRRENAQLQDENDILEKATILFARASR